MEAYQAMCKAAEQDYEGYWAKLARGYSAVGKKPIHQGAGREQRAFYKWFEDGELNVSYNCLDKHLVSQPEKTAIIFEADDGTVTKSITAICMRASASLPTA